MKFLLSTFEDFITGSGIWILVGCLAFALLVSILFLILNVEKEKKMRESNTTPLYIKREEKVEKERIQPVEVKTSEEKSEPVATEEAETKTKAKTTKPATKSQTKAPTKATKPATKTTADKKTEEKPKSKPVEVKKAETKAPAKKATPAKVDEEVAEESGNYDISYDAQTGEWVVKRENNSRATKRTKTKQEAIDYAKPLAEKNQVKLIIHTKKDSN